MKTSNEQQWSLKASERGTGRNSPEPSPIENQADRSHDPGALARKRRRDIILFRKTAKLLDDKDEGETAKSDEGMMKPPLSSLQPTFSSQHQLPGGRLNENENLPSSSQSKKHDNEEQKAIPLRGLGKNVNTATAYEPPPEEKATMTKAEISDWKKEQRKLRNRASARLNRDKMLNRIKQLEAEVETWKQKYQSIHKQYLDLQKKYTEQLRKQNQHT